MDFAPNARTQLLQQQLQRFTLDLLLPSLPEWQRWSDAGVYPLDLIEPLKAHARELGLWNLFLPSLRADQPGTRLAHVEYAPLAEAMGRLPWSAEVFNCSAPDSGNIELLQLFADPVQRVQWLDPLLRGEIRSAFAMSEPDVASSDPTQLETRIQCDGDELVINGRKWFITGAAHPLCRLLLVMGRRGGEGGDDPHRRHSIALVPLDTPGVVIERNIPVMDHQALEGHCEIVLRNVRLPRTALLGPPGAGFAMAQARLGPGRVHHAMRSIGQCELALELMCERALERRAFGQRIGDFANVQDWIAHSRLEIDQARLLVLQAAWRMDAAAGAACPRDEAAGAACPVDEAAGAACRVDPATGDGATRAATRVDTAAIKLVTAQLQTRVLDRAMQVFGAMGLTPDTPLARLWAWGRALRLLDGPDEVHLRTVARAELARAKARRGAHSMHLRRWLPATPQP